MLLVDCRGLSCPEPVIKTRRVLEVNPEETVTALVDSAASRDNLLVMAAAMGRNASWEETSSGYQVTIDPFSRSVGEPQESQAQGQMANDAKVSGPGRNSGPLVVVLASDRLGEGDETLGGLLMKSFLTSLNEVEAPATLICLNRGVFLTISGSPVLDLLRTLEARGTEVLSCGTCLDYYGFKDQLQVGKVSNMFTIVERLTGAGRLIRW